MNEWEFFQGAGAVIKTGELIYERVSLLGAQLGREISHHLEKYQQEILAKLHLIEERIYALCYKISGELSYSVLKRCPWPGKN